MNIAQAAQQAIIEEVAVPARFVIETAAREGLAVTRFFRRPKNDLGPWVTIEFKKEEVVLWLYKANPAFSRISPTVTESRLRFSYADPDFIPVVGDLVQEHLRRIL